MFGTEFDHQLIRKYVVLFGTLFNNITISRYDNSDVKLQDFKVPISYGPREKYLGMIKQKPDGKVQSIVLPRMTFETSGFNYNPERQLDRTNRHYDGNNNFTFELIPYDINFELNIIVKNNVDGTRIVEQILPYFTPGYNISAELIPGIDPVDLSIDLAGVVHEDIYQGGFEERRAVTWTLSFTVHGYFAKPKTASKLIKFIEVNTYPALNTAAGNRTTIQPGLTANGEPTTDIDLTIPYQDIDPTDDYGIIVTMTDVT